MSKLSLLAITATLVAACGGSKVTGNPDGGGGSDGGGGTGGTTATGGGDGGVACPTGGTGQLSITIAGLPTGTVPMVRVMGGSLTSPMVLTPGAPVTLGAGDGYLLAWRRVKVAPIAPAIIGKAFYLSNTPFDGCVKKDTTTSITLQYTQEPGSETLWMTTSDNPTATATGVLAGFAGADLTASAAKNPTVWKSGNFTGHGAAGAVDSFGNLWVPGGDRINQYDMMHLAMTSSAAPYATLTQPATSTAKSAAFDASGNLWVSRGAPTSDIQVVRYDASQLGGTGTSAPTPTVVITSSSFTNPAGIAFDDSGDLWVADAGGNSVLMFTAAHIAATLNAAADVVLTAGTGTGAPVAGAFTNPGPIAFDKTKNLWVGFEGNLVMLTPAQQGASASLMNATAPAALTFAAGTGAFAFDESGGLWTGGPAVGKFQRLPSTELAKASATASVTPTADIVIDASAMVGYPESLVINPSPTWSWLHDDF
ncbi:MAG TPA: hypothetical protein VHJ20_00745 [Polyangia bacterium]|nr:hypothetical protein [Polyangia bacterium]